MSPYVTVLDEAVEEECQQDQQKVGHGHCERSVEERVVEVSTLDERDGHVRYDEKDLKDSVEPTEERQVEQLDDHLVLRCNVGMVLAVIFDHLDQHVEVQ